MKWGATGKGKKGIPDYSAKSRLKI
jgi:hypothetical protein